MSKLLVTFSLWLNFLEISVAVHRILKNREMRAWNVDIKLKLWKQTTRKHSRLSYTQKKKEESWPTVNTELLQFIFLISSNNFQSPEIYRNCFLNYTSTTKQLFAWVPLPLILFAHLKRPESSAQRFQYNIPPWALECVDLITLLHRLVWAKAIVNVKTEKWLNVRLNQAHLAKSTCFYLSANNKLRISEISNCYITWTWICSWAFRERIRFRFREIIGNQRTNDTQLPQLRFVSFSSVVCFSWIITITTAGYGHRMHFALHAASLLFMLSYTLQSIKSEARTMPHRVFSLFP